MCVLTYTPESEERAEAQSRSRMRIQQSITNQDSIFMMYKDFFFAEDNTSDTVSCCRDMLTIKLADILVSVRTKVVSLLFVQSQVKLRTVLNYRFIKRR